MPGSEVVDLHEAYLIGCLLGRGAVEVASGSNYHLVFNVPFKEYSPVAVEIVETLLDRRAGLRLEDLKALPTVQTHGVANLGPLLTRLMKWHPPRRQTSSRMITKPKDKWMVVHPSLANEFLKWETLYHQRETEGITQYILKHLVDTATFLATNPVYQDEVGSFGTTNHKITCEITAHTYRVLRDKYGLEEGDVYRHLRIPAAVFDYGPEALREFVRGLADTIATVDVWFLPRVQFSIVNDNVQLPIDICAVLQTRLRVPVYYIGWAASGAGGTYENRGGRDHLVKVWVPNLGPDKFDQPLFRNRRKQEEFITFLRTARAQLKRKMGVGRKPPNWMLPCPLKRRKVDYIRVCLKHGCKQVKKGKSLDEFASRVFEAE